MKRLLFIFFLLSLCGSCSKDDNLEVSEKSVIIDNVNDLYGIVNYNTIVSKWFISTHLDGTIDGVECYYPYSLDREFQQENIRVVFSGEVYKMDSTLQQEISAPAGTRCFMIEIKSIKKDEV